MVLLNDTKNKWMIIAVESSIRDTIAFPKTTNATSLMDESPSEVAEEQLKELHIKLRNEKES